MNGFTLSLLIVVFLSGAGFGIAYTLSPDFSKKIDNMLAKTEPSKEEDVADQPNVEPEPQTSPQSPEPEPAPPSTTPAVPSKPKVSYLDFKHDPNMAPVPQSLGGEIIKVPPAVEQAIVQKYRFSQFPSLVDAVDKWTRIPGKIFPMEVTSSRELVFKVTDAGDEKVPLPIPAESKVHAIKQQGSMLVVKPQQTSLYEAQVPLFQTNVKEVVAAMYNRNVNAWFRHTLKLRNDARARYNAGMPAFAGGPSPTPAAPVPTLAVSSPTPQTLAESSPRPQNRAMNAQMDAAVDPQYGPMPRMDRKGAILCAAASIQKNELKNCELQFVQRWGVPQKGRLNGRPMWVVEVGYQVDSIFGRFPQEARAYIRNEKVEKWEVLDE